MKTYAFEIDLPTFSASCLTLRRKRHALGDYALGLDLGSIRCVFSTKLGRLWHGYGIWTWERSAPEVENPAQADMYSGQRRM